MKRLMLLFAVLTIALTPACGGDDDDSSSDTDSDEAADVITIKNTSYSGVESVTVGTTVTVKNEDGVRHTFTADITGDFQAVELDGGASDTVLFSEAGTYAYHCEIHSSMHGTIDVEG